VWSRKSRWVLDDLIIVDDRDIDNTVGLGHIGLDAAEVAWIKARCATEWSPDRSPPVLGTLFPPGRISG
jgi:hypothetical protein